MTFECFRIECRIPPNGQSETSRKEEYCVSELWVGNYAFSYAGMRDRTIQSLHDRFRARGVRTSVIIEMQQ